MVALRRVYPVFPVEELNYVAVGVADSEVVLDLQVLQRVHEAALHVAALLRPHRRVDEPLPPPHRVEEELGGVEPVPVVALDETLGLGGGVVPGEVTERPSPKPLLDPLSADRLLPQGGRHLPHVQAGAPRSRPRHNRTGILDRERLVGDPPCPLPRASELVHRMELERVLRRETPRALKCSRLVLLVELQDVLVVAHGEEVVGRVVAGRGVEILGPVLGEDAVQLVAHGVLPSGILQCFEAVAQPTQLGAVGEGALAVLGGERVGHGVDARE